MKDFWTIFLSNGLPDSIAQVFNKRPYRSDSKSTWRLYDNNACIKAWFRGNSVKQYNKTGNIIRTETTFNNPKSLGLKKPVGYIYRYFWVGTGCNDRFLDCCAKVDVSSIVDTEREQFTKPVLNQKGKKVTAPDLRKDRQIVLCKELLKPKYSVFRFKTSELKASMPEHFSNSAKVRYELKKLEARGVIKKELSKSFYRVTPFGWKWLWITITSEKFFKYPMISRSLKNDLQGTSTCPTNLEKAYENIRSGLESITRDFSIGR